MPLPNGSGPGLFESPSPVARQSAAAAFGPGAFHLPGYLDVRAQQDLIRIASSLIDGQTPAYVPVVRGGGRMHVRMLCLGRHWNGQTYTYEPARSDFDGQPAPPLPDRFKVL